MHDPNPPAAPKTSSSDREDTLLRRIEKLERTTRSLGVALVVALVLVGVTYVLSTQTTHQTVRTQELLIVDPDGGELASLGGTRQVTPARHDAHLTLRSADGGSLIVAPSAIYITGGGEAGDPYPVRLSRGGLEVTGLRHEIPVGASLTSAGLQELNIVRMTRDGETIHEGDAPAEAQNR